MAKLRRAVAYRRIERPNTRKSKYRAKSYVRASPTCKVIKFDMGNTKKRFPYRVDLLSKADIQLRDNALESARRSSNRYLETSLGTGAYHLKIRVYPHHVLRENPVASGAGADRFSTGMQKSFGKSIGNAAQLKVGQPIFSLYVEEKHIKAAREAMRLAKHKFACSCLVDVSKNE